MRVALSAALVAGALATGPAPGAASRALSWPGELAYVRSDTLYVGSRAAGFHPVRGGAGVPVSPVWSPDGSSLAFERKQNTAPYASLWAVGAHGSTAHRASPAKADVFGFSWRPVGAGAELAYYAQEPSGGEQALQVARAAGGAVRTLARARNIVGFAWAPGGGQLAVSENTYGKNGFGGGELLLVPALGGPSRTLATSTSVAYLLAGWWPDAKGLLYWADPQSSASIAADGIPLDSRIVSTGATRELAITLVRPEWVSWSPGGGEVAVVAGGNRSEWAAGRHVVVCRPVAGTCRSAWHRADRSRVTLGPAWQGRSLVYTVAPASSSEDGMEAPRGAPVAKGPFSAAVLRWWYGRQRLWAEVPGRTAPAVVAGAGLGAHDGRAAGGGLVFVRNSAVFYLSSGASGAMRMAGPVGPGAPYADNYYGYVDWAQQFAWHA